MVSFDACLLRWLLKGPTLCSPRWRRTSRVRSSSGASECGTVTAGARVAHLTPDRLLTSQDEFVANLLANKLALQNRLEEVRKERKELEASTVTQQEDREEVARLARLRELEDEVEKYRNEYQDLNKAIDEDQSRLAFLESQRKEAAERREEAKRESKPGRKTVRRVGPPVTLVLINGSVAPSADKLIQAGKDGGKKASEMLRNEVQLDRGTAVESESEVMVWVWYNRQDLVARLQADRVITVPSTWHNFSQGFARIVGNMLVDVDRNSVAEHMTAVLTKFGFMGNVEKIYVAGVHPGMTILPLVPQDEEGSPEELDKAFEEVVLPKLVLIDHRPNEEKEDLGGPTVTFAGLFDSSSSRPIVPPLQTGAAQPYDYPAAASVASAPAASPRCAPSSAGSSDWQEVKSGKRTAGVKLRIDPNKGMLHQDEMTAGQLRRFREDVARYPCADLRKTGRCKWEQTEKEPDPSSWRKW
ncbi:hypothetical protein OF846_001791 [Rhodotorula toruloides]|nr:hypothetical protein OF846_001791 [Rhodotorula toruloides]